MKTGKALIRHIIKLSPSERAEYLINVIDPYLSISPYDDEIYRSRYIALIFTFLKASKLFDCTTDEIGSCYNKYGYFLPIKLYEKYFYNQTELYMAKLIGKASAKTLWEEVEKPNIDRGIAEYEISELPISDYLNKLREKYKNWAKVPDSIDNTNRFMFYCWRDYIEPYLRDKEQIVSEYTVKSIIIAYCYMQKVNIYPILELDRNPVNLSLVHKILAEKYNKSYDSFRNDWNPIFKYKKERTTKYMIENIKNAMKLMGTIDHPKIQEAINLAQEELKLSELNK